MTFVVQLTTPSVKFIDIRFGLCSFLKFRLVGIHAVKTGNRFAALQPITLGLLAEFGATAADAGRGLTLRRDYGTQYTVDDLLNQVKFWGIAPSFAFVAEPQTNGAAEPPTGGHS